jgi:hypothetical protein
MDNFKKIIYGRIGEGDVEGAVDLLLEMLQQQDNSKAYKDALFLKSNLHSAKQQYEIKGVIARQEYELVVNKTLLGLENLLEDAEKGPAPRVKSLSGHLSSPLPKKTERLERRGSLVWWSWH